ncbi:hypothetical protein, conserved [Babesia ovata]|uniref:Uncharacterized protein n=1 Tax=Babesia ovata TaxID=189622 RepID=A0A2H6KKI9_9APIC|nr:uncharacterized protein BOVATA_049810 [Babesia ovata]GBE63488.1 hypothetical protein, conserved [Babesia ovata]
MSTSMEHKPLKEQLENWQGLAGDYLANALTSVEALKGVDKNLRDKLSPNVGFIKQVIENFEATVHDESVICSLNELDSKFIKVPESVNKHIQTRIHGVQGTLNAKFSNIENKIKNLREEKVAKFDNINKSISDALEMSDKMLKNFDKNYKKQIEDQFTTLKGFIKSIDPYDEAQASKGKSKFKEEVEKINENVQKIGKDLASRLEDFSQWNAAAGSVVSAALQNVTQIIDQLDKKKTNIITEEIQRLRDTTQQHYVKLKQEELKGYAQQAMYHLENFGSEVTRIVDAKFREVQEQYKSWVQTPAPGAARGQLPRQLPPELQTSTNPLIKISSAVRDAAQQVQRNNGGSPHPQHPQYLRLSSQLSPSESLTSSLNELPPLESQVQQIERQLPQTFSGQPSQLSTTHVSQHLSSLSELAAGIRNVVNDAVAVLNDKIKTESQTATANLNVASPSVSTEIKSLDEASQFAQQFIRNLHSQSQSQFAQQFIRNLHSQSQSQFARSPEFSSIQETNSQLSTLSLEVKLVGTEFTTGKKFIEQFDTGITTPFTTLIGQIHSAGNTVKTKSEDLRDKALGETDQEWGDDPKCGKCLMRIKAEIQKVKNLEVQKVTTAIDTILASIDNLEALPGAVEDAQQEAERLMNQLQQDIGTLQNYIDTIHQNVSAAEQAFDTAIKALEEALGGARGTASVEFQQLRIALQKRVRDAFNDLQYDVREFYSNQKKAELKALQESVSKYTSEIQKIITDDTNAGLKGLMRKLSDTFKTESLQGLTSATLDLLAKRVKSFYDTFFGKFKSQSDVSPHSTTIQPVTSALLQVLSTMYSKGHFHREVSDKIDALKKALHNFTPKEFADASPLLNVIRRGVTDLHEQLRKQYVSRYSGKEWNSLEDSERPKCAQILVTILKTLTHDLRELHKRCHKTDGKWKENKISLITKSGVYNPLGAFFQDCGYRVSRLEESYEGELRCHTGMRGGNISRDLFEKIILTANTNEHLRKCPSFKDTKNQYDFFDLLKCLTSHVAEYYSACHLGLPKSKKHPCSVRDICVWLSGLPHTAVYETIKGHCDKMLNEQDKVTGAFPNKDDAVMQRSLEHLYGNIKTICKLAPKLLVSIQGNGLGLNHAAYPYACCFENNHGQFYYPGDPSSLLGMLKYMCMRLLRAVSFLYQQCRYTASDGNGWRECQYGQHVGTYQWDCNEPNDNSNNQPKSQPKCQPNGHPNDQPNCLPKSPLQAHLMDGLPGFMPHKFTAVGCQPTCSTCPKGSLVGQCITPMGFADLATAGSITGRGDDLVDLLATFCKNGGSVLCELVHSLQCISPSPPKGLAEMLSYYCNIFQKAYGSVYGPNNTVEGAIVQAINESFPFKNDMWLHQSYQNSKLTDAFNTLYCSDNEHNGAIADDNHHGLHTLSPNPSHDKTKQCAPDSTCAPYLKALCHDACHTYPQKHKALYLSWLCRLAWTFWDLLDQLLKAFNDISCQAYGCSCKCGFGKHGVTEEETSQPPKVPTPAKISCSCTSIVECKGPMSVFYQYGFTFGMPKELMGSGSKKTCDNFVKQLNRVLTNGYFKELFDEIDDFIWAIRTPFSYLLLALWSLSLLYLLHITVVRLDVLRIRSHLRSPSSHRIAAQSLLAAARVRALANVKYFSP